MLRARSLATLAVAVLALGFARTSHAAIITFGDSFLLGMTVQGNQNLNMTGSDIDPGFPKAQTAIPAGLYAADGDPEVMFYDVGFRGDVQTLAGGGKLLIGQAVSFSGGAGDILKAEFSNDNNTPWDFGLWYQDADTNLIVTSGLLPLAADTTGSATLSVSLVNVKNVGFYVALAGGGDKYHVSLRTSPDATVVLVPEPASMLVWGLGLGVVGAVGFYKRRRTVA